MYAAIRSLGRMGIAEMVERCCAHARRFGEALAAVPNTEILNDVVLNQVLARFLDDAGDHDKRTRAVIEAVQQDGTCWLSGTTWHGAAAMRISVSSWATTSQDVERSLNRSIERQPKFVSPETETAADLLRQGFPFVADPGLRRVTAALGVGRAGRVVRPDACRFVVAKARGR